MTVTKILGAQAGIQYQGVVDKSEADPRDNLVNALFTGQFKNGPFNKPFKVTAANIRKALGFDPENLQYQAIEDCLKQGVPFVWVMRVNKGGGSSDLWIEEDLQYVDELTESSISWDIEINGTYYEAGVNDDGNYMEDYLEANQNTLGITGEYDSSLRIYNITSERKFVRLIPSVNYTSDMKLVGNPTASIDSNGVISFWLEANNNPPKPAPEPEPKPEICNCETSWVLIPELTPSVKIGRYDELVMGIKNYVQNTTMSYSADTAVIDLLRNTLNISDFVNHLELIRCDSEGTLLRNKTNDCLTISMWSIIKDANGNKEYISYLSEKDLCAYDANEVLPASAILGPLTDNYYPISTQSLALRGEVVGVIPFSVNEGMATRFSINVNSIDILGTMPEVIDKLMTEYQVAVSYMSDGAMLLSCNNDNEIRIAVSGAGINLVDPSISEWGRFNSRINTAYDPVANMKIYTFTLTKKYNGRMFAPALSSYFAYTLKLKINPYPYPMIVADSAVNAVNDVHRMSGLSLINLVDIEGNATLEDTYVKIPRWKVVPEVDRRTQSYVGALEQSGVINKYFYPALVWEIFYSSMAKEINETVNAEQPFIHWLPYTEDYGLGEFMFTESNSKSYFFDFGVAKADAKKTRNGNATLIKGYLPYYTDYLSEFPGYDYFSNVTYYD